MDSWFLPMRMRRGKSSSQCASTTRFKICFKLRNSIKLLDLRGNPPKDRRSPTGLVSVSNHFGGGTGPNRADDKKTPSALHLQDSTGKTRWQCRLFCLSPRKKAIARTRCHRRDAVSQAIRRHHKKIGAAVPTLPSAAFSYFYRMLRLSCRLYEMNLLSAVILSWAL